MVTASLGQAMNAGSDSLAVHVGVTAVPFRDRTNMLPLASRPLHDEDVGRRRKMVCGCANPERCDAKQDDDVRPMKVR